LALLGHFGRAIALGPPGPGLGKGKGNTQAKQSKSSVVRA